MLSIAILKWKDPILGFLTKEFQKLGHQVLTIDLEDGLSVEKICNQLKDFNPQFCLTNNFYLFDNFASGVELEKYFAHSKIPLICWHWEAPLCSSIVLRDRFPRSKPMEDILFLTADSEHLNFFKERNLSTEWLPLAIDSDLFNREISEDLKNKLSTTLGFVGTPFLSDMHPPVDNFEPLRMWHINHYAIELTNQLITLFPNLTHENEMEIIGWYDKFHPEIDRLFSIVYSDPKKFTVALENFKNNLKTLLPENAFSHIQYSFGRASYIYSYYQLVAYLNALQKKNIQIYGGETWRPWILGYPEKSEIRRLSDDELYAFFASAKIQFCATKMQFTNLVHDRPLAVLAVGGFPLTDERGDLPRLFKKNEIATYQNIEEASEKIDYFLSHESERQKISAAGREKVRSRHTYFHRARELIEIATRHFDL
ncbi:MAG: glycosyltransferase family 1 protein [Deltaproteobacteria bacterium]|nr:glycosyltransferase family 1 protein [Deltaproteobacteria bacterium]